MDSSAANKKEKKGLSKAWKKLKDSFKSKPSSTPTTTSTATPSAAAAKPTPTTTTAPKTEAAKAETPAPEATKTTTEQPTRTTEADRRLEKAKAIFKKYDFEFSDADWEQSELRPKGQYERVQKPIRMRVKYTCHECKTVFGHERICVKCEHKRCAECTRYPPKKKNKGPRVDTEAAKSTADQPQAVAAS